MNHACVPHVSGSRRLTVRALQIYDLTIVDAPSAVAVLGSDSIVYRETPVIETNGLLIHDIRFEYTTLLANPLSRYVYAAIARAAGVPIISTCTITPFIGTDQASLPLRAPIAFPLPGSHLLPVRRFCCPTAPLPTT